MPAARRTWLLPAGRSTRAGHVDDASPYDRLGAVTGSVPLFLAGATMHLFATTSITIFMATVARSMPQFGMLAVLVLLPLQLLSGNTTPRESMPELVQQVMLVGPTTHFVSIGQAVLFRGAGFGVVWPQFLALTAIGSVFFGIALRRFRSAISQMA